VDDAYISFRITQHIYSGIGPFFNSGEKVYSSTSLFYPYFNTIWPFLLGKNWTEMVTIINGVFLSLAIGCCIFQAIKSVNYIGSIWVLILSTLFLTPWFLDSKTIIYGNSGLETSLYMFSISIFCLPEKLNRNWLNYFSWATIFIRPEAILIGISRFLAAKNISVNRNQVFHTIIPALVFLGIWALIGQLVFGSTLPQSIIAKGNHEIDRLLEIKKGMGYLFFADHPLELMVCAYSLFTFSDIREKVKGSIVWAILYIAFFSFFAAWWPWYFPPLLIAFWYITMVCTLRILQSHSKWFATSKGNLVTILLFTMVVLKGMYSIPGSFEKIKESSKAYMERKSASQEMGKFIVMSNTPNETILIEPLGLIGWYSKETNYLDYPGLTKPEMSRFLSGLDDKIPHRLTDPILCETILKRFSPDRMIVWKDEKRAFEESLLFQKKYQIQKSFPYSLQNPPFDSAYVYKRIRN
jgi:hypothetical protein